MGLVALTGDQTYVPCIAKRLLTHWTTRQVPIVLIIGYSLGWQVLEQRPGSQQRQERQPKGCYSFSAALVSQRVRVLSCFCRVGLFATAWTVAHQAPLCLGSSRQEYWSGLPCPPPVDCPDPGIKPASLRSPASAGGFFTTRATCGSQGSQHAGQGGGNRALICTACRFPWCKHTTVVNFEPRHAAPDLGSGKRDTGGLPGRGAPARAASSLSSTCQVAELFRTQHPALKRACRPLSQESCPAPAILPLSPPRFKSQHPRRFRRAPSLTRQPPCHVLVRPAFPECGSARLVPVSLPHLRAELVVRQRCPAPRLARSRVL